MRTTKSWWRASVVVVATIAVGLPAATATARPTADRAKPVIQHGVTQPVFGYADAIRERVFVTSDVDSDGDGARDIVAMDIIRPKASANGLKVPVIMDASPYYSTVCRGNETECKRDLDGDGLNDQWPLFYDNYFVPRGYAVVLLDMIGTNNSTGCPVTGGRADNISAPTAIDWLNGRRAGTDASGKKVVANWHNGKTGMIGKSYDGTLANAAAASGVKGLSTIVPISAISSWYDYSRSNGLVTRANNYSGSLANTVTNPDRRSYCAPVRTQLGVDSDDTTGDYSPFWAERDYVPSAGKVRASVFVVHGINDNNVRADHFSKWWDALAKENVPRKLWLTGTGHIDPFDFRRGEWVDTLHRWFDFWLYGVRNGIMNEPMADIERSPDVWETHRNWPVPGTKTTPVALRPGVDGAAGELALTTPGKGPKGPKASKETLTFQDTPTMSQANAIRHPSDPQANTDNRLVFLSQPLKAPLHISGSPIVKINASVNGEDTSFAGLLVDYGTQPRFSTVGDGIRTLTEEDCWGEQATFGGFGENACYRQAEKTIATNPQELVTKGILDGLNLKSLSVTRPLVPGKKNAVEVPLLAEDYVFEAGNQIGVVLLGSYSGYSSRAKQTRAEITVHFDRSVIELPIVGGRPAAMRAGL